LLQKMQVENMGMGWSRAANYVGRGARGSGEGFRGGWGAEWVRIRAGWVRPPCFRAGVLPLRSPRPLLTVSERVRFGPGERVGSAGPVASRPARHATLSCSPPVPRSPARSVARLVRGPGVVAAVAFPQAHRRRGTPAGRLGQPGPLPR
jgi:hypothetical protein